MDFFDSIFSLVFGVSSIVAGAGVFVYTLYNLIRCQKSLSWPRVEGSILSIDAFQEIEPDGNFPLSWNALVRYEYHVGETLYRGRNINLYSASSFSKASLADELKDYSTGEPAAVYYNPEKPRESVLIPGLRDGDRLSAILCLLGGPLFVVVGIYQFM